MSGRDRRRLFAVAGLVVAVTVAALALLGGRSAEPPERSPTRIGQPRPVAADGGPTPAVDRVGSLSSRPEREDLATRPVGQRSRLRREHAAQRLVARRFLRALLRYELGEGQPAVTDAIRANAEPALARLILSAPPRVPARSGAPPPGRVVGVDVTPAGRPRAAFVAATIDRGGRTSGLLLELRRRGVRWLVSGLG